MWKDPEFGPTKDDQLGGNCMYQNPNLIFETKDDFTGVEIIDDEEVKFATLEDKRGILPGMPLPKEVEWISPRELLQRKVAAGHQQYNDMIPVFIDEDGATANDVLQSKYLGDCWFISALTLISQKDAYLRGAFIADQNNIGEIDDMEAKQMINGVYPPMFHNLAKYGIYVMKFFKDGKYRFVVIDDRIVVRKDTDEIIYS